HGDYGVKTGQRS
ncbi:hypothetical protein A2U01_0100333, partial [Trifolium medium]|nr:hypothetical protein [Trifolium medium]